MASKGTSPCTSSLHFRTLLILYVCRWFIYLNSYVNSVTLAPGCGINSTNLVQFVAAQQAASEADVTVLVLGIDRSIEDEGKDRISILLPEPQIELAQAVIKGTYTTNEMGSSRFGWSCYLNGFIFVHSR